MHLKAKMTAVHSVQEVKADGKLAAKPRMHFVSEQPDRFLINQVETRQFHPNVTERQKQAVFLGHTVETPAVVLDRAVQAADLFHPLPSPRRWIKQRHQAKRARCCLPQCLPDCLTV